MGGTFSTSTANFGLTNVSAAAVKWGGVNTSAWLTASSTGGTLAAGATTNFSISLNAAANALPAGIYAANVTITNQGTVTANPAFALQVGKSVVQNGGFETGNYSSWTFSGDGFNGVDSGTANIFPHTGSYAFNFGQAAGDGLARLSQTLATIPGQTYLLSFWLTNIIGSVGQTNIIEQFQANWITNLTGTNMVLSLTNPPAFNWTNYLFLVTANGTNTTLQFAAWNDYANFGLDDVSVTPVPSPSFTALAKTTNGVVFSWNTLAGLSYLVQYKTNLLQTNWISLATNTAAGATVTFTNGPGPDARRFYRIRRQP